MSNNQERKKHVNLTPELFEMIRNHYKTKKFGKLSSLTGLSRSRIYDLIDIYISLDIPLKKTKLISERN